MATPRIKQSREQALDYLQSKGLLTKSRSEYTTAYAKRLASQYKRADAVGKPLTRKEARGKHPGKQEPRVRPTRYKRAAAEKVIPEGTMGPLQKHERYSTGKEKEHAIVLAPNVVKDLERPLKYMGYPTKVPGAEWVLLVYGYARESPTNRRKWSASKPVHYRLFVTEENLKYWLKNEPKLPILDFVNMYSEYGWTEILSIAVLGYHL
jgi:hypothetical protein